MKKISKIVSLVLVAVLLLGMLCACSEAASYAGSWYSGNCPDGEVDAYGDREDPVIILTKDGTFSWDGYGGEYTVEDGKIILVDNLWGSAVLEIDKVDGETVLVDEDGKIYFKGETAARKYYEKEVKEILEDTANKYSDDVVGSYTLGYYNLYSKAKYLEAYLTLNADGTYEFTAEDDTWQKGTWEFVWTGSLPDESDDYEPIAHIELTETDGSGDTYVSCINQNMYVSGLPEYLRIMEYYWFKD